MTHETIEVSYAKNGMVDAVIVGGTRFSREQSPQPPTLPRVLKRSELQKGMVLSGGCGPGLVIAVGVPTDYSTPFCLQYPNSSFIEREFADGQKWHLLRPAPPLFEQLRPGDCVKRANGTKTYVCGLDLHRRTWAGAATPEAARGERCVTDCDQFTESDLTGAQIVYDWPEVTP